MDNKKKKGLWHLSKVEKHIINKYIKKQPSLDIQGDTN